MILKIWLNKHFWHSDLSTSNLDKQYYVILVEGHPWTKVSSSLAKWFGNIGENNIFDTPFFVPVTFLYKQAEPFD